MINPPRPRPLNPSIDIDPYLPPDPPSGSKIPITIRPFTRLPTDAHHCARLAHATYLPSALSIFLSPHAASYPSTAIRGYRNRMFARTLTPRNLSLVATAPVNGRKGEVEVVVGYIQAMRLGEEWTPPGSGGLRTAVWVRWLAVLSLVWGYYCKVLYYFSPDHSASAANLAKFDAWNEIDEARYWENPEHPERRERWHIQSCVVAPGWQKRGIGRRFMEAVFERARSDRGGRGVPVGIEASPQGERLYRACGCELLGGFAGEDITVGTEEEGGASGGVFIWVPEQWRDGKDGKVTTKS